jgi:beta-phosphoglucomutase family hydrolase
MIKAIIFDFDGLMVDSEPAHYHAFKKALKGYEVRFLWKDHMRYLGISDKEMCEGLVKEHHLELTPSELMKKKDKAFLRVLQKIRPMTGLSRLLKRIRAYKKAVASGSHKKEIQIVLRNLGLLDKFDIVVSSDEVKKGKPAPDLFLLAAKKLGVKPSECLVLEDAANGVVAAKAAGMKCYLISKKAQKCLVDRKLRNLNEVDRFISPKGMFVRV